MNDSFADAPVSIAELRADRERDGALWTPRDALVALLREIDQGKVKPPAGMVIIWCEDTGDGHTITHYSVACPSALQVLGLLTRAMHKIQADVDARR